VWNSGKPGQGTHEIVGECEEFGENWWSGAPDSFMEHLAMIDLVEGATSSTTWLEHVTDADYLGA